MKKSYNFRLMLNRLAAFVSFSRTKAVRKGSIAENKNVLAAEHFGDSRNSISQQQLIKEWNRRIADGKPVGVFKADGTLHLEYN